VQRNKLAKGTGFQLWSLGSFSQRCLAELKKRGWTLYPNSAGRMNLKN
jgi:hypothetical protein